MPKALVSLKLYGYWGLPQVEAEAARSPAEIDLPDEVTLRRLLTALADRYGERFRARLLTDGGELRRSVRVLLDDQVVEGEAMDAKRTLNRSVRVSVTLLTAMMGG